MAGFIGGTPCDFIHGNPTGKTQRVVTWEVPGVAGYGVQVLGLGDSEFRIVAVKLGINSVCRSWANSILAMKGVPVALWVDSGSNYASIVMRRIQVADPVAAMPYGEKWQLVIDGVVV